MRVCVVNHQGNGVAYADALQEYGHRWVGKDDPMDVLLVDYPGGWGEDSERWQLAKEAYEAGALVLEIPHGAAPPVAYDGHCSLCPYVHGLVVPAQGHLDWYRSIGFDVPFVAAGWHLCQVAPFTPPDSLDRVLFAPGHPNTGDGQGVRPLKQVNAACYRQFVDLDVPDKRMFMYLGYEPNGTWPDERVTTVPSHLDPVVALEEIDAADAVVSYGTFAWLAVARGKPTVFIGQDRPPIDDDGSYLTRTWDTLGPLIRHPFDSSDGLASQLATATVGGPDVDSWKTRWIGETLDPGWFVRQVEQTLAAHRKRKKTKA